MSREQVKAEFIAWCRNERASALDGIDAVETRYMRLHSQTAGSPMVDITDSHVANLRRIIAEMDRLIADLEADNP